MNLFAKIKSWAQNEHMVTYDENDKYLISRQKMVKEQLSARGIKDEKVLNTVSSIPREEFVSVPYQNQAYNDNPLPIGMGQTISQPYIVALMTEQLDIKPEHEVLEIGTGSGYQTAILAKMCKKVYTIERHNQLQESAQAALARLKFDNIEFYVGDGTKGWPDEKQFDRIIVTAAPDKIPDPLVKQLKPGGKIIIPVGGTFVQKLVCGIKKPDGSLQQIDICGVRFVKLVGEYGHPDE